MKETLISFQVAKLAKEKGFNEICDSHFEEDGGAYDSYGLPFKPNDKQEHEILYARPTQSLLQKWLREVHDIIVTPCTFDKGFLEKDKFCYQYYIENKTDLDDDRLVGMLVYKTWEEALEKGLQEALKFIADDKEV